MDKASLQREVITLRNEVIALSALATERAARIEQAIAAYRALQLVNRDLTAKLCGQIKRGNLLKARVLSAQC